MIDFTLLLSFYSTEITQMIVENIEFVCQQTYISVNTDLTEKLLYLSVNLDIKPELYAPATCMLEFKI